MTLTNVQIIGRELALKWDDGKETYWGFEALRRACPCAGCKGEVDVMGNLHRGPEIPLTPKAFVLVRLERVGGYAIQPFWADGHSSGLFSYEYLRQLGASADPTQ